MPALTIRIEPPYDLSGTLRPLQRGAGDPVMLVDGRVAWRAVRLRTGTATLWLDQVADGEVRAEAWGTGAEEAVERAAALAGAFDDRTGFVPAAGGHDAVIEAWRGHRGIRLTRTPDVLPVLLAAVTEQKVTGLEARRAWRGLVRATSEPAPPAPEGPSLLLPPDPARVLQLPSFTFHGFGVTRRQGEVVKEVVRHARRVERLADGPEAREWLVKLPGIGPWTAAEAARLAFGDPDAVSVGDFHLPNLVAWALAGEPRGTDERMLELLEPYRGHRGRVQRLLEASGLSAPKFGPKQAVRSIERI